MLDSIISDCESVKGQARNRFSSKTDTKGMITNSAIYAMLADMYLWRASLHQGRHDKNTLDSGIIGGEWRKYSYLEDYQMAVDYSELCLQALATQNEEERNSAGLNTSSEETINYGLGSSYSMIKNTTFEGASQSVVPRLEALTSIFKTGNSRESIFELQYRVSDGLKNEIVNSLYGYGNGTHLQVCKAAFDPLYVGGISGTDVDCGGMWDSRLWVCCQNKLATGNIQSASAQAQAGYYCMKYQIGSNPFLTMDGTSSNREIKSLRYSSVEYNNWIVYRMTDVMLIKAEALACLGNSNANAVKAICNAIHRRSYCNFRDGSKVPNEDATKGTIGNIRATEEKTSTSGGTTTGNVDNVKLVLNERQIELLGEGKRWFDLVRYAERNSYTKNDPEDPREPGVTNGQTGVAKMVDEFLKNAYSNYATTLKNRFKNRWGLYCPIYYMEVKASNGAIEQNPVWNKSKYEQ